MQLKAAYIQSMVPNNNILLLLGYNKIKYIYNVVFAFLLFSRARQVEAARTAAVGDNDEEEGGDDDDEEEV
jgi:hypothetical protein